MTNKLLVLSEFQPLHFWFERTLIENLSKNIVEVLFCIDWAHRKLSDETPFSTREREEMIRLMIKKYNVKYSFFHLRDEDTDEWRENAIRTLLQPLSWIRVLSDNKKTHEIITWLWFEVQEIYTKWFTPGILRNQIAAGHIEALRNKIPQNILDYIIAIDWYDRSKSMKINLFHWPSITVDIIARNEKWEIAIIDRGGEPFGKALPWGFIEYWDSGETTAAKECVEETNMIWNFASTQNQITVKDKIANLISKNNIRYWYEQQPFYVMTDTQRDKRGHMITLWYIIDVTNSNEMKALDDATWLEFIDPYVALTHPEILSDHKVLISAYIAQL